MSGFEISNNSPLVIIGGINVIESRELAFETALHFKKTCNKYKMPLIFKASFDKANRSSFDSYRGPGIIDGLDILNDIKVYEFYQFNYIFYLIINLIIQYHL